jgi:hypothetical protein
MLTEKTALSDRRITDTQHSANFTPRVDWVEESIMSELNRSRRRLCYRTGVVQAISYAQTEPVIRKTGTELANLYHLRLTE